MGRLGRSREPEALSCVKSQEHELKQTDVGTDCVELTPVDMKTLMVEAGSPVACSGEEVTNMPALSNFMVKIKPNLDSAYHSKEITQ